MASPAETAFERVLRYQDDLIGFFTNSHQFSEGEYAAIRADLLQNPDYNGLAPKFIRRCRDTGSLWSFAKSVDGSWEPRRKFLREEFEPLLDHLETSNTSASLRMPGQYDASAWTGIQAGPQRAKAIRTLIPIAQSALECLIDHLEKPSHNGGPPLDEVNVALENLRALHTALGTLLALADDGELTRDFGEGLAVEIARYARRATKALKSDPLPYALSATLLGILTVCGLPGLGGYLGGVAMAIRKPVKDGQ